MKVTLALWCTCFALSQVAPGQTSNLTLEQIVGTMVFRGIWEGGGEKELQRGGDAAAVALTKVVCETNLDQTQMDIVLEILKSSFSKLSWVEAVPDRKPRTTLFVLRYSECSTQDPRLKEKIADTRRHILEQAAKAAKPGL